MHKTKNHHETGANRQPENVEKIDSRDQHMTNGII